MQDGHTVAIDDDLCWWAGDHFEKATEEEQRRLGDFNGLTRGDFENDPSGWSRRGFGAGPVNRNFTIDVGDKLRIEVKNKATGGENSTVSIDLRGPGTELERIGTFQALLGKIGKSEYQHVFRDRE